MSAAINSLIADSLRLEATAEAGDALFDPMRLFRVAQLDGTHEHCADEDGSNNRGPERAQLQKRARRGESARVTGQLDGAGKKWAEEENEVEGGGSDEELGSSDDLDDNVVANSDTEADVPNLILCHYVDRVKKRGHRHRAELVGGIMNLNGIDYVWDRANAVLDF